MRRLACHVFTILSALSLVLCVTVGVLWVRNYYTHTTSEILHFSFAGSVWRLAAAGRSLVIDNVPHLRAKDDEWTRYMAAIEQYAEQEERRSNGELLLPGAAPALPPPYRPDLEFKEHTLPPPSVLTAAAAILPATWLGFALLWHVRARVRRKDGLCMVCGYDLRASPERCPECGTAVQRAAGTQ